MKRLIWISIFIISALFQLKAQDLDYKIIKDTPDENPSLLIFLNAATFDALSLKDANMQTSMSLGAGVNAKYFFSDKISFDAEFNYKYFPMEGESKGIEFEAGGQFNVFSKLKRPSLTKVTLSKSETYETYVLVPDAGIARIHFAARGGVLYNQFATSYEDAVSSNKRFVSVNTYGVYTGISVEGWKHLIIELTRKRNNRKSIHNESAYLNFYGDVIFGSSTVSGDITNPEGLLSGGLGYRFGMDYIISVASRKETFGRNGKPKILKGRARLELGKYPGTGYYVKAVVAYRLFAM